MLRQLVAVALILRGFDGISRLKNGDHWLLFSDPDRGGQKGNAVRPDGYCSLRWVDCKNEGLEEETLVTSSNPFSQVLW